MKQNPLNMMPNNETEFPFLLGTIARFNRN